MSDPRSYICPLCKGRVHYPKKKRLTEWNKAQTQSIHEASCPQGRKIKTQ